VLTEADYAEARTVLGQGSSLTRVDGAILKAVSEGARPGDPVPPPEPRGLMEGVTDTELIFTGSGPQQRVAVLFSYADFPGVRFGHRFPRPSEELAEYAAVWFEEEVGTGALHRMMQDEPTADEAGIVWTTWGS
jgi:hypothetical protein